MDYDYYCQNNNLKLYHYFRASYKSGKYCARADPFTPRHIHPRLRGGDGPRPGKALRPIDIPPLPSPAKCLSAGTFV